MFDFRQKNLDLTADKQDKFRRMLFVIKKKKQNLGKLLDRAIKLFRYCMKIGIQSKGNIVALLRNKFNGRVISPGGCWNHVILWGFLKENVYVIKPAAILELKDEIILCFKGIEPQLCLSISESLDYRMEVYQQGLGDHLADILFQT